MEAGLTLGPFTVVLRFKDDGCTSGATEQFDFIGLYVDELPGSDNFSEEDQASVEEGASVVLANKDAGEDGQGGRQIRLLGALADGDFFLDGGEKGGRGGEEVAGQVMERLILWWTDGVDKGFEAGGERVNGRLGGQVLLAQGLGCVWCGG